MPLPNTAYPIPENVLVMSAMNRQHNRVGNARYNYTQLGKGSGRIAYDLGDGNVLKLAWNRKGVAQNKVESQDALIPYYNQLLAPVLISDPAGKWLIQSRLTLVKGGGYNEFCRSEEGRAFRRKAGIFAECYGLNPYDLTKSESIGFTGSQYLIFDYGLTEAVFDKYYIRKGS